VRSSSCAPNANVFFEKASFCFEVRALRPIAPGEEITITYIPLEVSRAERQQKLLEKYAFLCACPVCAHGEAKSKEVDSARAELRNLADLFHALPINDALEDLVRQHADNFGFTDEQFIDIGYSPIHSMDLAECEHSEAYQYYATILCAIFLTLGNLKEAKRWANIVHRTELACFGERAAEATRTLVEDIESSSYWKSFWRLRSLAKEKQQSQTTTDIPV